MIEKKLQITSDQCERREQKAGTKAFKETVGLSVDSSDNPNDTAADVDEGRKVQTWSDLIERSKKKQKEKEEQAKADAEAEKTRYWHKEVIVKTNEKYIEREKS